MILFEIFWYVDCWRIKTIENKLFFSKTAVDVFHYCGRRNFNVITLNFLHDENYDAISINFFSTIEISCVLFLVKYINWILIRVCYYGLRINVTKAVCIFACQWYTAGYLIDTPMEHHSPIHITFSMTMERAHFFWGHFLWNSFNGYQIHLFVLILIFEHIFDGFCEWISHWFMDTQYLFAIYQLIIVFNFIIKNKTSICMKSATGYGIDKNSEKMGTVCHSNGSYRKR